MCLVDRNDLSDIWGSEDASTMFTIRGESSSRFSPWIPKIQMSSKQFKTQLPCQTSSMTTEHLLQSCPLHYDPGFTFGRERPRYKGAHGRLRAKSRCIHLSDYLASCMLFASHPYICQAPLRAWEAEYIGELVSNL